MMLPGGGVRGRMPPAPGPPPFHRGRGLLGNAPNSFPRNGPQNMGMPVEPNLGPNPPMMPNNFQLQRQQLQQQQLQKQQQLQQQGGMVGGINTSSSEINQIFNVARDTQLALVSSLLKENLRNPLGSNLMAGMASGAAAAAAQQQQQNSAMMGMNPPNPGGISPNNMAIPPPGPLGPMLPNPMGINNPHQQMAALTSPPHNQMAPQFPTNHSGRSNAGPFQGPEPKRFRRDSAGYGHRSSSWQPGGNRGRHDSQRSSQDEAEAHSRRRHDSHNSLDSWESSDRQNSANLEVHSPGSSQLNASSQEEYDPAQPTEEPPPRVTWSGMDSSVRTRKRQHSEDYTSSHGTSRMQRVVHPQNQQSDLRVTINTNMALHSPVLKNGLSNPEGAPRDTLRADSPETAAAPQFFCYACNVDCQNLQNFDQHMQSPRHMSRMSEMMNLHVQKTDQQLARLKAQEHLRRIEGRDNEDYCRICDKKFHGNFLNHRKSQEHKRKERLTRRGCKLCNTGSFTQYPEYVRHIDSEPHKKKKAILRASCAEEEEPDNMEELVTVDATGIYGADEEGVSDEDADQSAPVFSGLVNGCSPSALGNHGDQVDIRGNHEDNENDHAGNHGNHVSVHDTGNHVDKLHDNPLPDNQNESQPHDHNDNHLISHTTMFNNQAGSHHSLASYNHLDDNTSLKLNELSAISSESSNTNLVSSDQPIGEDFVIPVCGFLCTLCGHFYQDEAHARRVHCSSTLHKQNYKKSLEEKKSSSNYQVSMKVVEAVAPSISPRIDSCPNSSSSQSSPQHNTSSTGVSEPWTSSSEPTGDNKYEDVVPETTWSRVQTRSSVARKTQQTASIAL